MIIKYWWTGRQVGPALSIPSQLSGRVMAVSLLLLIRPIYLAGLTAFTLAPYLPIPRRVNSDIWACSPEGWPFQPFHADVRTWSFIPYGMVVRLCSIAGALASPACTGLRCLEEGGLSSAVIEDHRRPSTISRPKSNTAGTCIKNFLGFRIKIGVFSQRS